MDNLVLGIKKNIVKIFGLLKKNLVTVHTNFSSMLEAFDEQQQISVFKTEMVWNFTWDTIS